MDGAVIVGADSKGGAYALAVDDDGCLGGYAGRDRLGVRVYGLLNLAEVAALDGSGPLLSRAAVSVLDLDKLGTGRNLAVEISGDFRLIVGTVKTLIPIGYVSKQRRVVSAAAGASDASSCGGMRVGSSLSNGASARAR